MGCAFCMNTGWINAIRANVAKGGREIQKIESALIPCPQCMPNSPAPSTGNARMRERPLSDYGPPIETIPAKDLYGKD